VLNIRLENDLSAAVEREAKRAHVSRTAFVREAVARYLEDLEDLRDAEAVLKKRAKPVPLSEVKKILGL